MIAVYALGAWRGTSRKRSLGGGHTWDSESWQGDWDQSRHNRSPFSVMRRQYKSIMWSEVDRNTSSVSSNWNKWR